ncbi:cysteine hydrolase family protein [Paenibacillus dokdonensis]|uniref:cysteine hydrolase family protein n=1 Tax=Paenibacillus dokdonensis TaxID=2567944 RepID=UPI0010A8A238|nr:cysteine hydrolase family protein [Paenibacillus dokdonensis]
MTTALLIIDMQIALFSYEDEPLYRGEQVLDNIRGLTDKARRAGAPVIYVQHCSLEDDEFREGCATWPIHPQIAPLETDMIVKKYSWDSFHGTPLQEHLQKLGVQKLVIAGGQTEFCLDTTCRRAYSLGYKNILVRDAHSTLDSKQMTAPQIIAHHEHVLGGRFVELQPAAEVVFA